MLFNSWSFLLIFLPIALLFYWILRRSGKHRLAILSLAIASYIFYSLGEVNYPWLLGVSIVINYGIGSAIQKAKGSASGRWLVLGIAFNLLLLGYFKYLNFFIDNINHAGIASLDHLKVILPVGISFYTFTQIAFLVDATKGKVVRNSPLYYGLFVTFFPHLIAGPILHHAEMMPQFDREKGKVLRNLITGGAIFAIGLIKKVVIADQAAPLASQIFGMASAGQEITFAAAWLAVLSYTVQIYFDFSGYSDMALGLGRMFGIDLPINFNSPYKALTIADFWRRWHISLSRFLRDYLYIPLGGNRKGPARRQVNLFLTMVLGGIWHGAGWTFLLWGALHGGYLVVHQIWTRLRLRLQWPPLPSWCAWTLTLLAAMMAWVPFRANGLHATLTIWSSMLGLHGVSLPDIYMPLTIALRDAGVAVDTLRFDRFPIAMAIVGLLVALIMPNSQQIMSKEDIGLDSPGYDAKAAGRSRLLNCLTWRPTLGWSIALGLGVGIALRWMSGYSEFIYFQF